MSLAGLYHDIGKKEIDSKLLEKPRHLVSQEERRTIEGHVVRGQEILSAMPQIPSDVVQIVFEHHEDCKGRSAISALEYITKIHGHKIDPECLEALRGLFSQ